jgi:HemY protein
MLWSLFKILLFVAAVAAAAWAAQWLISVSGEMRVVLFGNEFTLSPLEMVLGLIVLAAAIWLLFKLLGLLVAAFRFINGDDTALSRYFARHRERKGYEAVADSLLALASGEAREAAAKAQKAERYLDRPEITRLLYAQASEAAGERDRALETYKDLVRHQRTRFVGVRGLMRQKLEQGDEDTAMKLAEKAFALKPRHVETQDTLLRMQAKREDWEGARRVLSAKLKSGALPKDVYKRREAVLGLAEARAQLARGDAERARAEALEANRLSPELVPAAVLAARMLIERGETRRAEKVLRTCWAKLHHPDLAAAYADIAPGETPNDRIRRFAPLLKVDPDSPESRMLNAELHIAAEDFPGARRALGDMAESNPTARSLSLMAAIERGEGAPEAVVRGWLARALSASRGPQWVCDVCGTVHGTWVPVCTKCEAFDSLAWTEPRRSGDVPALGSDMLPLLTGPADRDDGVGAGPATPAEAEVVTPKDAAAVGPTNGAGPARGDEARTDAKGTEAPKAGAPVGGAATAEARDGKLRRPDPNATASDRPVAPLPAGDSPPAPQDKTPTTAGSSRM